MSSFHWSFKTPNRKKKQLGESPHQILANCKHISLRTFQLLWLFYEDLLVYLPKYIWSMWNSPNLIFQSFCGSIEEIKGFEEIKMVTLLNSKFQLSTEIVKIVNIMAAKLSLSLLWGFADLFGKVYLVNVKFT